VAIEIEALRVADLHAVIDAQIRAVAAELGILTEDAQLEALIPCMRPSAQDTLAALRRAGFRIVKEVGP